MIDFQSIQEIISTVSSNVPDYQRDVAYTFEKIQPKQTLTLTNMNLEWFTTETDVPLHKLDTLNHNKRIDIQNSNLKHVWIREIGRNTIIITFHINNQLRNFEFKKAFFQNTMKTTYSNQTLIDIIRDTIHESIKQYLQTDETLTCTAILRHRIVTYK